MVRNTDRYKSKIKVTTITPVIVSCLICLFLYHFGWLATVENHLHDNESFFTRKAINSDIVIIEIDHTSLKQLESWPWPRRHYAKVINNLLKEKAKAIFIDIDFSSRSNPSDDDILANTLNNTEIGTILMPAFIQYSNSGQNKYLTLIQPNEKFRENITAVSVNLKPDSDGLVRHINLMPEFAGKQLATAATIFNNYSADTNEYLKLNLRIAPASFKHISFYDIYSNNFDASLIKDKFIIIGATALELSDQIPLPVYQSLAGPMVQAIAIQTLSQGKLTQLDASITELLLILICLPVWFFYSTCNWRKGLILLLSTNLILLTLSVTLHTNNIILFDAIPFILLTTLSFIFLQLSKLDRQLYKILSQKLKLNKNEAMMSHIIKSTGEGIILLDKNLTITTINSAAEKIFGVFDNGLVNTSATALLPGIEYTKITNHDTYQFETEALHRDNFSIPVEIISNQLTLNNEQLYTIFIHDISERKAQQKILTHKATHDSLTGLKNRAFLISSIKNAINAFESEQCTATLIMIDLNNFKDINDTLSHNVGDKLLSILGKRLKTLENEQTCVARLGGDEFSLLTNDKLSDQRLIALINKIQRHISKPIELSDISITIEAAIGVAHIPEHAKTTDSILIAADVAMYKSKDNREAFSIYNPLSDYREKRNLTISNDIKQALNNNQFQLYYQPKIDFKSSTVTSLEALIRWQHPTLGMIQPDEFIPIIENSSLIKPVTMFTIEAAIIKLKQLQDSGLNISVAINLSTKLLEDNNLSSDINTILTSHGVSANNITLEITESAAISSHKRSLKILNKLKDNNIKLSIDDFGTSYASYSYLKQLPAAELKIDKLFITNICKDNSDKIIASSIISLAHGFNMQVVAEGIEDKETYDYLNELGCDIAQGYWISEPMAEEDIADWVNRWNEENKLPELRASTF